MGGWYMSQQNKAFSINLQEISENNILSSQDEAGGRFVAFSGEGQSLRKKGRKP